MDLFRILHRGDSRNFYIFGVRERPAGADVGRVGRPYLLAVEEAVMRIHPLIDTQLRAHHRSTACMLGKTTDEAPRVDDETAFVHFILAKIPPAPQDSRALQTANSGWPAVTA
ncbi:hypothetical protein [Hyphomicrobium methylovorum]|uniref:hypothetical protein n=1 Tax=Hyphomicrobium methylovorum TaxID=84 RepID=UPI0015E6E2DA|nr:hypothetical protein [Hyphomicrobium methylovorum]